MKTIHSALFAGAALLLVPTAALAQDVPAAQPAVATTQAAAPAAAEVVLPANSEVVLTMNETVTSKSHRLGEKFSLTVAQDVPAAQPAVAATEAAAPASAEAVLPANSEVVLTMNETVTSKSHRLGEKFSLTVAQDVKANGMTVIPRGTRAVAQITRRTGKGGFGKAGKMDFTFRYLDHNGMQIPIEGRHHQSGDSRTGATVGAVVAAGLVGGMLVKGKSAKIEEGREFTVRTVEAIPVVVADGGAAVIAASYTPARVTMMTETDKQRKAREKAEKARGKKAK